TVSSDYKNYDRATKALQAMTLESQIESGGAWVGTPAEIRDLILQTASTIGEFEHASLQVNFGEMPLEVAEASLELFGQQVLPAFSDKSVQSVCQQRA